MEIDRDEICREYRQAKDKDMQIRILSELNMIPMQKVVSILVDAGEIKTKMALCRRCGASFPMAKTVYCDVCVRERELIKMAIKSKRNLKHINDEHLKKELAGLEDSHVKKVSDAIDRTERKNAKIDKEIAELEGKYKYK